MRTILGNLRWRVGKSFETFGHEYNTEDQTALTNLMENLEHLGRMIETRMRTTPKEERERASNLAWALVNGKKALQEAEVLRITLENTRLEHRKSVEEVEEEIGRERKLLEKIKLQRTLEITRRREELEVQMREITDETLIEKRQMTDEITLREIEYKNTCAENLKKEKEIYAARKEVEQRYLGILSKYDREVGELHRTMESLIAESDLLENKLRTLEKALRVQEIEYVEVKNERETVLREAFMESLNSFMRERAAKRIQRTWRAYWERQLLRKKKKCKKKKQ
ncbi:IQ domain-containing protein D isoform X2 [Fopius arisanus]|nr:PREDICTED: IQ domain-containing protein D-like isoform X2 [Fopius arisanus]